MDREATPPEGFELHAVVGDNHPTLEVLGSDYSTKTLRDVKFGSGDGTVLRTSVLLDERPAIGWSPKLISPIKWKSIVFAAANHMGLTSDRVTLDNVLFNILERPAAFADP